jgi:O-antigen ligase
MVGVLAILSSVSVALAVAWLVVHHPDLLRFTFSVSPLNLAALGGVIVAGIAAVRSRELGLILLVLAVYLNLSQVLVRYHNMPSFLQLLFIPLLIAALRRPHTSDRPHFAGATLVFLLISYSVVLLLSSSVARRPDLADARFLESLKTLAIYFLIARLGLSERALWKGTWTLVTAAALLGSMGIVQALTGSYDNEFGGLARIKHAQIHGDVFEPRIAGPLGDPNYFAQILLIAVPIALFLGWSAPTGKRKVLAYGCATVISAATVLTYSRGGALALIAVLALAVLSRRNRWRLLLAGAATLGILLLLLPANLTRRLATVEQLVPGQETVLDPDSSFAERRLLTRTAWRMFLDHPFLGVGAGNYTAHFPDYAAAVGSSLRAYDEPDAVHYPHSLYLEVAAETGILGLAILAAIIAACFLELRSARAGFLAAGKVRLLELARAFEIALAGFLISSLFLHGHYPRYLWMIFGFASALRWTAAAGQPPLPGISPATGEERAAPGQARGSS